MRLCRSEHHQCTAAASLVGQPLQVARTAQGSLKGRPTWSESSVRVCLFTDTLADVNGVSRFIRTIARVAHESGRELQALTSTRLAMPEGPGLLNFRPALAGAMPRYPELELALPPARAMLRAAGGLRPDVVHISTPGPVGLVGLAAARMLGVPVVGVYHTDFPAYIERLFDDAALEWMSRAAMRRFYGRFAAIFTRSQEYARAVSALGIPAERLLRLRPGIDTSAFQPRFRDEGIWRRAGLSGEACRAVKVLYAGRISIEKDLPLLTRVWGLVRQHAWQVPRPQLVIMGDGPYRAAMERELGGGDAHFLGFRHGDELSALYASADVLVFPSTTDTLGQVVMEAQSSGLPVLVSDRGGPREVVHDGVTGQVLPAGNVRAWARAIIGLVEDEARRMEMGRAAHEAMREMSIRDSFEHFWSVHEAMARSRRGERTRKPPELRPGGFERSEVSAVSRAQGRA
jgi:glycosyltransferase involved in cell wall biosynthesis